MFYTNGKNNPWVKTSAGEKRKYEYTPQEQLQIAVDGLVKRRGGLEGAIAFMKENPSKIRGCVRIESYPNGVYVHGNSPEVGFMVDEK